MKFDELDSRMRVVETAHDRLLRKEGQTARQATKALDKLSVAQKNELLWQRGINFNDLPLWQRRGVGIYWESYQKTGTNPLT